MWYNAAYLQKGDIRRLILRGRIFVASVEYLIKQFLSEDKKILDLSNQVLGDKGAVALAKSKHLKRVTRLTLANNNISDEGAIAIANSEKF